LKEPPSGQSTAKIGINHRRIEEVVDSGADLVLTSCPYCLTMFEDAIGAKGLTDKIDVLDITEALIRERKV